MNAICSYITIGDHSVLVTITTRQCPHTWPCVSAEHLKVHEGNDIPVFRMLSNEVLHHLLAFGIVEVHDLDTTSFQVPLATNKSFVLA